MIQVIDNVISEKYQDKLEDTLFNEEFIKATSPSIRNYSQGNIGYEHWFFQQGEKQTSYELIDPLFKKICNIIQINGQLSDARTFLQEVSINEKTHDIIHVDMKVPHLVFLYYVKDSDGDTIIFNRRYSYGSQQFLVNNQKIDVLQTISPQKGRVVIFDGLMYHAAGIPRKNKRCAINFNVFLN